MGERSPADILVALATDADLFHAPGGQDAYATVAMGPTGPELTVLLRSARDIYVQCRSVSNVRYTQTPPHPSV